MQLNILDGKNNKENLHAFIRKAVSDSETGRDYRRLGVYKKKWISSFSLTVFVSFLFRVLTQLTSVTHCDFFPIHFKYQLISIHSRSEKWSWYKSCYCLLSIRDLRITWDLFICTAVFNCVFFFVFNLSYAKSESCFPKEMENTAQCDGNRCWKGGKRKKKGLKLFNFLWD